MKYNPIVSASLCHRTIKNRLPWSSMFHPMQSLLLCLLLSSALLGQVSFFSPPTYKGSGQLYTTDLNRDGKPDLVSNSSSFGSGQVQLGNGDGTFTDPGTILTYVLAVTDFNGDGKPDVLQQGTGTLDVSLGNGDGTFQTAISTNSGASLTLVTTADLNSDGKADAIGVFSSSLMVYLSNGDGTFAAGVSYGLGSLPTSVVMVGDFNGDLKPDIAVLTQGINVAGQVELFLGNGDGSLQQVPVVSTGLLYPSYATVGDFNKDGHLDIAASWQIDTTEETTSILLGNGDGTFQSPTTAFEGGGVLAAVDLRGSGTLDLVVYSSPVVEVYPGNGDGTFTKAHSYMGSSSQSSTGVAIADFNLDGTVDIAAGNDVLLGNGDGTFRGQPAVPSDQGGGSVASSGDFNGDGFPDIVDVVNMNSSLTVNLLLSDGLGTLSLSNTYPLAPMSSPSSFSVVTADFNDDGKLDVAVVVSGFTFDWTVVLLLGNGDGSLNSPISYALGTTSASAVIAADFNNDHLADLAIQQDNGNVAVLLGNGDGTFQSPVAYFDSAAGGTLLAADYNGDGYVDIAAGAFLGGQTTALLFGNGNGTFQAADFSINSFSSILSADVNEDGKPDLIGHTSTALQVLLGNGDGTFHALDPWTSNPAVVLVTDLNGDGVPDLIQASGGKAPSFGTYLGSGDGSFGPLINIPIVLSDDSAPPFQLSLDLNQDQKLDLVVGFSTVSSPLASPGLYVLLNTTDPVPGTSLSPTSLSYASQIVGTSSASQTVTLTNTGAVALSVSSVSITGVDAGQFSQTNNCAVVQPSTTCTVQATFTPGMAGSATAVLAITDNAVGSPHLVALSGTGTFSTDIGLTLPSGGAGSQTIAAGQTATYTLSIGGAGFSGQTSLTCSGAPAGATCLVTPASLMVSATASSEISVTVATAAPAVASGSVRDGTISTRVWMFPLTGLVLVLGSLRRSRSRVLAAILLFMALLISGCGEGSRTTNPPGSTGTAAGTYPLTVAASSGSVTQSVTLTLVVQ